MVGILTNKLANSIWDSYIKKNIFFCFQKKSENFRFFQNVIFFDFEKIFFCENIFFRKACVLKCFKKYVFVKNIFFEVEKFHILEIIGNFQIFLKATIFIFFENIYFPKNDLYFLQTKKFCALTFLKRNIFS